MAKKKLSAKEKAINRIVRRLKTKKEKGEYLKVKPTKKAIRRILEANNITVDDLNVSQVVGDVVKASERISKEEAKKIKKTLGKTKWSDVQKIKGQELHDIIQRAYNNASSPKEAKAIRAEILKAYGYDEKGNKIN